MEKKDLQSRREFFKEAAKKSLPILAGLFIGNNHVLAKTIDK